MSDSSGGHDTPQPPPPAPPERSPAFEDAGALDAPPDQLDEWPEPELDGDMDIGGQLDEPPPSPPEVTEPDPADPPSEQSLETRPGERPISPAGSEDAVDALVSHAQAPGPPQESPDTSAAYPEDPPVGSDITETDVDSMLQQPDPDAGGNIEGEPPESPPEPESAAPPSDAFGDTPAQPLEEQLTTPAEASSPSEQATRGNGVITDNGAPEHNATVDDAATDASDTAETVDAEADTETELPSDEAAMEAEQQEAEPPSHEQPAQDEHPQTDKQPVPDEQSTVSKQPSPDEQPPVDERIAEDVGAAGHAGAIAAEHDGAVDQAPADTSITAETAEAAATSEASSETVTANFEVAASDSVATQLERQETQPAAAEQPQVELPVHPDEHLAPGATPTMSELDASEPRQEDADQPPAATKDWSQLAPDVDDADVDMLLGQDLQTVPESREVGDAPDARAQQQDAPDRIPTGDERLEKAWNLSTPIENGRTYVAQNDQLYQNAQSYEVAPGEFGLVVHGNPSEVAIKDENGQWIQMSPEDMAKLIKSDPSWNGTSPVRLVSCNTGDTSQVGNDCFAQRLADHLGVDVIAPDKFAAIQNGTPYSTSAMVVSGKAVAATRLSNADGAFVRFHPR